ncbi:MAG: hypothetical protein ACI86P_001212 [Flavobacteriales bacterium]|jgi:hypothetical protein
MLSAVEVNSELEIGDWRLEIGDWRLEIGDLKKIR